MITTYAMERILAVNDLVRTIHGGSYEWYGFTLAEKEHPECIIEMGLPFNDINVHKYTGIGPENISMFSDSLPDELIINGWVHSHGSLEYREFSKTDEMNHLTVLDYVGTFLKKRVSIKEILIDDLQVLTKGSIGEKEKENGNVWIVTDKPISEARVFEIVYGSFCYGIVVGDTGWHTQQIYYKTRGILTGTSSISKMRAQIVPVDSGRIFNNEDKEILAGEIKERINPREQVFFKSFGEQSRK